jgi:hypothetical protein
VYVSSQSKVGDIKYELGEQSGLKSETLPIALELGTDGTGAGTPKVVANDPITFILEDTLVKRLDVASVGC